MQHALAIVKKAEATPEEVVQNVSWLIAHIKKHIQLSNRALTSPMINTKKDQLYHLSCITGLMHEGKHLAETHVRCVLQPMLAMGFSIVNDAEALCTYTTEDGFRWSDTLKEQGLVQGVDMVSTHQRVLQR